MVSWGSLNPMNWGKRDAPTSFGDHKQIQDLAVQGLLGTNRGAPILDENQQAQFRQAQLQQMGQLQGIASGQQQGAGELAVQRQVQNALAGQQAQARMARGGNALIAARRAANASAGIGLAGAGQAQQAAMGDQMNAQGLLSNVTQQGRTGDLSLAGQNASLDMQQRQLNQNQYQAMLDAIIRMNQSEMQAGMANASPGFGGAILSGAGQMGAAWAGKK